MPFNFLMHDPTMNTLLNTVLILLVIDEVGIGLSFLILSSIFSNQEYKLRGIKMKIRSAKSQIAIVISLGVAIVNPKWMP